MSLVHLDWHISKINGKEVCVVLDDGSRFILAGGEFAVATAEISIELVRKVLKDFGEVRRIREVVTDHGTNSSPTSWIKTGILRAHLAFFWPKMESFIFWPA